MNYYYIKLSVVHKKEVFCYNLIIVTVYANQNKLYVHDSYIMRMRVHDLKDRQKVDIASIRPL